MKIHKKYNKIQNLYKAAGDVLNLEEVTITEKIDGTNFSFGWVNGEMVMNSRNNCLWVRRNGVDNHIIANDGFGAKSRFFELYGEEPFEALDKEYKDLGVLVYGEFFGRGIQKRIDYGDEKRFAFFDAYSTTEERWLTYSEYVVLMMHVGVPTVKVHYRGEPSLAVFEQFININSYEAEAVDKEEVHEGIIIKGTKSETNKFGERCIAKYKTESFAERSPAKKVPKDSRKDFAYVAGLAEQYTTASRLDNCLEKLRGESVEMSMSSTGRVIAYMQNDVFEDLTDEEKSDDAFDKKKLNKFVGAESVKLFKEYLQSSLQ